jgi:hypothetical protein
MNNDITENIDLDSIIARLLEGKGKRMYKRKKSKGIIHETHPSGLLTGLDSFWLRHYSTWKSAWKASTTI